MCDQTCYQDLSVPLEICLNKELKPLKMYLDNIK